MTERLDNMPDATELVEVPSDDLLGLLADMERRVTMMRVELDQLGIGL